MAAGFVQVAPDSTGKKLQTFENTVGANLVEAEAVTLVDTTGTAIATLPVSAASLPLPALAATSTKQSDGTQKSQIVDGSGNVIASTSNALNVNIASSNAATETVQVNKFQGAANLANAQFTASTTAATLIAARATRRSVSIRNLDSTNSVYIGIATVTSGNGMLLKPLESISVDFTGLIQVISAAGSPIVATLETYD